MTTSTKTAPYSPTETDAYAVAVPQESYQAPTTSSSVSASRQYSTNDATASYATVPPPVNTISHTTPTVLNAKQYIPVDSRKPVVLTYCPHCRKENIKTRTHDKSNSTTALCVVAGVLIFWPLCWLPLCIRPMKQTNHYCSSCGVKVGRVKPFQ